MDEEIIKYDINLSAAKKQLENLTISLKNTRKQIEVLNENFKAGKIGQEAYTKAVKQLTQQEQKLQIQAKQTSQVVQKNLNESMKQGLENADGLGKGLSGVSSIISGNVLGAIGNLKESFSALGGPIGIVVGLIGGLLVKLLPLEEIGKAIGDTFSRWGRDFKNFFGIGDSIQAASDNLLTFQERIEKSKEEMEKLKQHAQDVADATNAWVSNQTAEQKREENQFMSSPTGNTENLERAVELQKNMVLLQEENVRQALVAKEAEAEAEQDADKASKLYAEAKKLEEEWQYLANGNGKADIQAAQYRNELIQKRKDYYAEIDKKREEEHKKELDRIKAEQEARRKAEEEQRKMRESSMDALDDLQIEMIEDADEKQKAQIIINTQRALRALDELYKKADDETKNYLDRQRDAIIQVGNYQLEQVDKQAEEKAKADSKVYSLAEVQLNTSLQRQLDLFKKHYSGIQQIEAEANNKREELNEKYNADILKQETDYQNLLKQIKADTSLSDEQKRQQELDAQKQLDENKLNIEKNYSMQYEQLNNETTDKIKAYNLTLIDSWTNVGNNIASVLNNLADNEKENSKSAQRLAIAAIYIQEAAALAKGISSAASLPFPANLGAIAGVVAELISTFSQVSQIKSKASQGYATGGYVSGPGSGTSDSINARLSNGEFVVNASSTSSYLPLLQAINAAGRTGSITANTTSNLLASEIVAGISAMPNPVVSVEDITTGSNRVSYVKKVGVSD